MFTRLFCFGSTKNESKGDESESEFIERVKTHQCCERVINESLDMGNFLSKICFFAKNDYFYMLDRFLNKKRPI